MSVVLNVKSNFSRLLTGVIILCILINAQQEMRPKLQVKVGKILERVYSIKLSEKAAAKKLKKLVEDPYVYLEFHAAIELDNNRKESIGRIALLLSKGNKNKYLRTLKIFASMKNVKKDTFKRIMRLLQYPDEDVTVQAVKTLRMLSLPSEIDCKKWVAFLDRMLKKNNFSTRAKTELVDLLGKIQNTAAFDILQKIIESEKSEKMQKKAVLAMHYFPTEEARRILQKLILKNSPLQSVALEALARKRDVHSIPFLIEELDKTDDRKMSRKIDGALKRISLVTSPNTPEEWRDWWERQSNLINTINYLIENSKSRNNCVRAILIIENFFYIYDYMADFLVQSMADEDNTVRRVAARAIRKIDNRFGRINFADMLYDVAQGDISSRAFEDILELLYNLQAIEIANKLSNEFE